MEKCPESLRGGELMTSKDRSLEDIALLVACYWRGGLSRKNGDSLARALLGSEAPKYKKPCSVYLFQTDYPELIKFGISVDPIKRAKSVSKGQKDLYKELLFSLECKDRMTALAIEQALIQRPENLSVFAPHHLDTPPEDGRYAKQYDRFYEIQGQREKKGGTYNTELSFMSAVQLKKLVSELKNAWESMTPIQFFEKHAPERMKDIYEQKQEFLDKTLVIVQFGMHLTTACKVNYGNFIEKDQDFEHLVYPFELPFANIYIPLEKVPDKYKQLYGKEMA